MDIHQVFLTLGCALICFNHPPADVERFLQHEPGDARRMPVRIVTLEDED